MKLISRQRRILLICAFSFFLIIAGITSTFLLVNSKEKSLQTKEKNNSRTPPQLPPPTSSLEQAKNEAITTIEKKLIANDTPDTITEYNNLTYKDRPFIVYNSGGHFQPLIKKF